MKKSLLAPLATAFLITSVQANNNDSVVIPISGDIITSLSVTLNNTGITMPDAIIPPAGETDPSSVALTCNSDGSTAVAYQGGANPFANGNAAATVVSADSANNIAGLGNATGTCAELLVTGEDGYHYQANITQNAFSGAPAPANIVCNANTNGKGTIGTTGLFCGATVNLTSIAGSGLTDFQSTGNNNAIVTVVYD